MRLVYTVTVMVKANGGTAKDKLMGLCVTDEVFDSASSYYLTRLIEPIVIFTRARDGQADPRKKIIRLYTEFPVFVLGD